MFLQLLDYNYKGPNPNPSTFIQRYIWETPTSSCKNCIFQANKDTVRESSIFCAADRKQKADLSHTTTHMPPITSSNHP